MNARLQHRLPARLLAKRVEILLVGAGGTGSRILEKLVCLHRALIAKGHPAGLMVTVVDPDTVSPANIARQAFYPGDVGGYKADVLVNRANMALGDVRWKSAIARLDTRAGLDGFDLVVGAVDNRAGRLAILRGLENCMSGSRYWLDTGNRASDGQVVLGEVPSRRRQTDSKERLPHVGELYPQLIDPAAEDPDDAPSCSLAQALERQALYINAAVSDFAMNILWTLFTDGQIDIHGAFINMKRMTVTPLRADPTVWERFGVTRDGRRHKVVRPSVAARTSAKVDQTCSV
ncbi:PRTRC system ThiF family protein [Ramlibacter sp. AN1133]|uniref:PRTRC system ThiF family protein n=1 Tax=Ramlibacter sp. AN1133 TaxID=3133429 RepID=UPI0030C3045D